MSFFRTWFLRLRYLGENFGFRYTGQFSFRWIIHVYDFAFLTKNTERERWIVDGVWYTNFPIGTTVFFLYSPQTMYTDVDLYILLNITEVISMIARVCIFTPGDAGISRMLYQSTLMWMNERIRFSCYHSRLRLSAG